MRPHAARLAASLLLTGLLATPAPAHAQDNRALVCSETATRLCPGAPLARTKVLTVTVDEGANRMQTLAIPIRQGRLFLCNVPLENDVCPFSPTGGFSQVSDVISFGFGATGADVQIISDGDPITGTDQPADRNAPIFPTFLGLELSVEEFGTEGGVEHIPYLVTSDFGTIQYEITSDTVPEPSTLALIATGGVGVLGGALRRRRRGAGS
jgi:hypothetical protein